MFISDSRGQGLIEYIILVALIAVATIGMVRVLQTHITAQMANIVYAIHGQPSGKKSGDAISEDMLRKKDFSDFMNGAVSK
jgi:pilus assembly protein Flp/PilA